MLRKDIMTRKLANGTNLSIPVFYFKGRDKNAPKVYIQSGVHASEVQGYNVALNLIEKFSIEQPEGDVTIVPIANPYALNNKVGEYTLGRIDPINGDNWNRHYLDLSFLAEALLQEYPNKCLKDLIPLFKNKIDNYLQEQLNKNSYSYSKKLAIQLQKLAQQADIVLDLHCDTISTEHIYSGSYAMKDAVKFGINCIIEIPHSFGRALDETVFCPWLELVNQYNKIHKTKEESPVISFTIELGGQEIINCDNAKWQSNNILNYLCEKKVITDFNEETKIAEVIYSCKLEDFKTVYAKEGGFVLQYGEYGKLLKEGDFLYKISTIDDFYNEKGSKKGFSINIELAKEQCIMINHSVSPIIHESMVLMKLMTNLKVAK